jgi:polysaccharide pyruvyl transferase WcaK-like protein
VAALEELPVVGVRGPLSKAQLDEAGARNVVVCADPAVALHASYVTQSKRERDGRPLRVGINAGDCQGRLFGQQEHLQEALASAARWLRNAGHHVEIIPVWIKDVEACNDVARRAQLDRSQVSSVCYSQAAFLSRVEKLDLLVSLKLHAGILAAAANVPFVSLEYRPKCRDFASSLGWEEFLIRTDKLDNGTLIERIAALISQLDEKRADLCRRMCGLMNTFENYCRTIEPLLLEPELDLRFASRPPDPVR